MLTINSFLSHWENNVTAILSHSNPPSLIKNQWLCSSPMVPRTFLTSLRFVRSLPTTLPNLSAICPNMHVHLRPTLPWAVGHTCDICLFVFVVVLCWGLCEPLIDTYLWRSVVRLTYQFVLAIGQTGLLLSLEHACEPVRFVQSCQISLAETNL